MSEPLPPEQPDLARQARQHLASLKSAGIEFLPFAKQAAPPPATPPAAPAPAPRVATPPVSVPAPPKPAPTSEPAVIAATALFNEPAIAAATEEVLSPDQRRQELTVLAERVKSCTRCDELVANRSRTVFGVGPISPDLCFIGEAPGMDEDRKGEPFVGAAGQLLNRIIAACGLKREEVYIANICKCRPPQNRTPLPPEAANCREYLDRQLELVKPKFICTLGACATQNLLQTRIGIMKLRGSWQEYRGIPVMCTLHPSYLLHVPEAKKDVWDDMKKLLQRMGRPIPGQK
ncbi:MAG: uracil-DNA glycosylase [Planctomycetia bacterium]|nr:uracil-DNA glycosylase [Planctomycetia bacterium]